MLRDNILAKAKSYVGLRENPPGSNNIIFNTDYYGREVSGNSYSWCACFVWDIFRMCNASKYYYGGKKTASCTTLLNYYKRLHPEWVTMDINQARQGDLVFYQFDKDKYADHIGIFDSKYSSSKFYAIEGNTSLGTSGSQSNGEYVARRLRKTSQVMAFVHIVFDDDKQKPANPYTMPSGVVKYNALTQFIAKTSVKWMQWELVQAGYDLKIDGKFGEKTLAALKDYQAKHNLDADGKCGPKTKKEMINS